MGEKEVEPSPPPPIQHTFLPYKTHPHRALCDRVPDAEAATRVTVLMVVGAGRGPLVRASIAAAARAGRLLKVYAVEKNTNALVRG